MKRAHQAQTGFLGSLVRGQLRACQAQTGFLGSLVRGQLPTSMCRMSKVTDRHIFFACSSHHIAGGLSSHAADDFSFVVVYPESEEPYAPLTTLQVDFLRVLRALPSLDPCTANPRIPGPCTNQMISVPSVNMIYLCLPVSSLMSPSWCSCLAYFASQGFQREREREREREKESERATERERARE